MKLGKIAIILSILLITVSCEKVNNSCMQGTVIGKIRSGGGGLAVSLDGKHEDAVSWQYSENVIELLNIPEEYQAPGTKVYFSSRTATTEEKGVITTDGDETIDLVLYGTKFSDDGCP
jgi:hypothetical protein